MGNVGFGQLGNSAIWRIVLKQAKEDLKESVVASEKEEKGHRISSIRFHNAHFFKIMNLLDYGLSNFKKLPVYKYRKIRRKKIELLFDELRNHYS